ncbi:nuclease-related domain-containing protein [Bacillus sp. Hm123]|uniref:nuclease-related domain-containing protein n=1 Tax=Bacillus sp. Hm123 TaxID=3450745 RepID=UPI003F434F86
MIMKPRSKPLLLSKLEVLMNRLPKRHSQMAAIEEAYGRHQAGYRGEQTVDYFLREVKRNDVFILHDIRLPAGEYSFFQIDTVLLTPNFFLIMEVKNYSGQLLFKGDTRQLIRTLEGKEEVFADPILQMRRQQRHFIDWLAQHNVYSIPVLTALVMSNSLARIDISPPNKNYINQIIHASEIPDKIDALLKTYSTPILQSHQLQFLSTQIIQQSNPYDLNIMARFQVLEKDIVKGVRCPACKRIAMTRMKRSWQCLSCHHVSKNAHFEALQEYAQLFGHKVTTKRLADFFQTESLNFTYKFLKSLQLKESGHTKNRCYSISNLNNDAKHK